ncbi:transcription factor Adf-1-like [Adelges cooleyi]|uniref:transcription factor Adf-1-like n=1 Tax=Adelges cooleyi TaxID=133065 RepID=UPI00218054CD|nr:transcription factor Adf-1-like [Adelges cooleyi]
MYELLIEKVRQHEVLYNVGSVNYRDQQIRQAAWEEIGKELKLPGSVAKQKWEQLRRCFCNARNRRRDDGTKSGMSSKKKSLWKYEPQMSFVLPFLESRKIRGNLIESQTSANLISEPEDTSEGSEEETQNEQSIQDDQAVNDEATFSDVEPAVERREHTARHKKQKPRTDGQAQQVVELILKENLNLRKRQYDGKCVRQEVPKTNSQYENLDDTDMFFLSMAKMTKRLPTVEQAQIKLALSNSVLSAEIIYNQQSRPSASYPTAQQPLLIKTDSPVPSDCPSS